MAPAHVESAPAIASPTIRATERSAPLFGLTCASMHGMRLRWARHSGRSLPCSFQGLLCWHSLAFLCLLGRIRLELSTKMKCLHQRGPIKSPDHRRKLPAVGGGASPRGHKNSGSGGGSSAGGSSSGRGNGGTGQGSPQNGSDKRPSGQLQETGQGSGSAPASAEAGSSPLLPILLAIAALAGISIGVVTMRQRRRRHATGTPVSPKAG